MEPKEKGVENLRYINKRETVGGLEVKKRNITIRLVDNYPLPREVIWNGSLRII